MSHVKKLYANPSAAGGKVVTLKKAADIKPEKISWLWKGYLAREKEHLLAGPVSSGKTTVALKMAATISKGGAWPDGTQAETGDVIIWSGEDGVADTLVPRLIAAGANLDRVHIVSTVSDENKQRGFDPSTDLPALAEEMERIGNVSLIIIDPFVAAVERASNSHNNKEVRQGLEHVKQFAERTKCAVLGIHHFSKGTQGKDPVERVTGSIAFVGIARIVLTTMKNRNLENNDAPPRLMVRAKSNIGPDGGGFGYDILTTILTGDDAVEASHVQWLGKLDGEAGELMNEAETTADESGRAPERSKASAFLAGLLKDGPVAVKEIQTKAKEQGLTWGTVKRARTDLKIPTRKESCADGNWYWALSESAFGMGF